MEIKVTDENFETEVLKSELPCLVDFWASWCGPCLMVSPVVEQIANEYHGKLKVAKLNVDEAPKTASKYSVMSIPTIALFKGGDVVEKTVGAAPKEQLVPMFKKYI